MELADSLHLLETLSVLQPAGYGIHDRRTNQLVAPTQYLSNVFRDSEGMNFDGQDVGSFMQFVHPDDVHKLADLTQRVDSDLQDQAHQTEVRVVSPKGEIFHFIIQSITLRRNEQGDVTATFGAMTDITRIKKMELRLTSAKDHMIGLRETHVEKTLAASKALIGQIDELQALELDNSVFQESDQLMGALGENLSELAGQVEQLIDEFEAQR